MVDSDVALSCKALYMTAHQDFDDPRAALADIRNLMSRTSRVLSLSGLSGAWAGLCALVAAGLAYRRAGTYPLEGVDYYTAFFRQTGQVAGIETYVFTSGLLTMLLALAGAVYFTMRRVRSTGRSLWNAQTRAMLTAMIVPLVAGGLLVIAHWKHNDYGYSAAITLIFYGLALLAGGRYTLDEIRTLGYCEVTLGVVTAFFPDYGIDAWAFGFGLLHIFYGGLMWWRYER